MAVLSTVLTVLLSTVAAGSALSQRWLVDAVGLHRTTGIVAAVALGVAAHTLSSTLERVADALRNELVLTTDQALMQEVIGITAGIGTVEHMERPDYLNRLALLRGGAWAIAGSWTSALATVANTFSLLLSLWLLAAVHPALTLLVVATVPTLLAASRARQLAVAARDRVGEAVRRETALHDMFLQPEPAKEVWISGNGAQLDRLARAEWRRARSVEASAQLRGLVWQTAGWACYVAGLAAALWIGATLARHGRATPGDVMLIITLASMLGTQIAGAVGGLDNFAEAGRITEHYLWLQDYATARAGGIQPAPERLTTGIRLHGITFRYPGSATPVLQNIDLDLPAGSTVGLVGVNGAGKSTLVKLLCGFYHPDEGQITVNGTDLRDIDPAAWASRCSGTLQDFAKLQLLVRETVGIGDLNRLDDPAAVQSAIDAAGAHSVVAALPNGRDTQLGPVFNGAELSHGQWQKLALARGRMRQRPLLMVLDEPTAALDPQAEHELFQTFTAQARRAATETGAVIVLVSHRFSTVNLADHIVVLDDGTITERGTHQQLMDLGGHYARLYATQADAYR
ncbi:ABC transporter ATP-binding protein [Paractinoplanes rishiriensis]|uniref:ABC transporter permease n=1 Tax=Paractinoplanes rishiriensis TaxID=1050105 RepID=A0A919K2G0_9ACTN|nr:ABC transporter ATP-binding protein [Actinoplanes rishiriensis]GIE99646.1 ABC transporter permease [Actinoplanes rishiriensis]